MDLQSFFNIGLIILSIALTAAILLQAHRGGLGSVFGGDSMSGQYKTRRGLERTIFLITIGLSVAFFVLVLINVFVLGRQGG